MKPWLRLGAVAAGYVAAFLVASAAVAVRVANTSGPDAQAASGMYAAGDAMLFVAVFGALALVPTGAALFYLRRCRPFWTVLAALGAVVAMTSLGAAGLFALGRHATAPSLLATLGGLSMVVILIAPLFALGFLLCTVFSPYRVPRVVLLAAALAEAGVTAYGGLVWFVPLFFSI